MAGLDPTVYENVLANMDDGVIAVDHTGRIMTCHGWLRRAYHCGPTAD